MIKLKDLIFEQYAYAEIYNKDKSDMTTAEENQFIKIARKFGGEVSDAGLGGIKFEFDHRPSRDAFVKSAEMYMNRDMGIRLEN